MNKKGAGLRPMTMSIVLIVVFTFFIFTFVGLILQEQNPSSEVLNSKYGLNASIDRMQGVVDDFAATSDSVYNDLGSSEPTAVDFIFALATPAGYTITGDGFITSLEVTGGTEDAPTYSCTIEGSGAITKTDV